MSSLRAATTPGGAGPVNSLQIGRYRYRRIYENTGIGDESGEQDVFANQAQASGRIAWLQRASD